MKRVGLVVACAVSLAAAPAQGQGIVYFGNNSSTAITNALTMMRVVAGTTFRVALYYMPDKPIAPTREEMELSGIQVGASGIISPAAGLYAAGTRTPPSATLSAFFWIQIRAWESAFGTSYEDARNNPIPMDGRLALRGTSNIFRVKTGDPANNLAPGALTAFGLQGFIVDVPEPGSIGIAIVGLGVLLLLRRREPPTSGV